MVKRYVRKHEVKKKCRIQIEIDFVIYAMNGQLRALELD